jgi:hypothetical protein
VYCVQETWLEDDFRLELKHWIIFVHHGREKQPSRRGSGGVGIFLSPQAAKDWAKGGNEVTRGGLSTGETKRYVLIKLNNIQSNSTDYTSITLVSSYFLDSSKTKY